MRQGAPCVFGVSPTGLADGLARVALPGGSTWIRPGTSVPPLHLPSRWTRPTYEARQYSPGPGGNRDSVDRYHRPPPRGPAWPSHARHHHEDLRRHPTRPRAQLAARGCRGPDPRPPRDPDRRRAARQAQADLHASHRHGRLRRGGQRGEDFGDGQQTYGEALLPALGLPRRPEVAHAERHARAPSGGGHPPRRARDAASQPARAQAADEAEGLRRPGAPPRRADAATPGDQDLMAEENRPDEEQRDATPPAADPAAGERPAQAGPAADEPAAEESAPAEASPADETAPADPPSTPAEEPVAQEPAPEDPPPEAPPPAGPR